MALVRSDPFRDVDRLFAQFYGGQNAVRTLSMTMPMDAYRKDDSFVVKLDLPGVSVDSVDLTVEDNVLTIKAERPVPPVTQDVEPLISERPHGIFSREVILGNNLDAEHIDANYEAGVLTLVIPVAERAKPRRIQIGTSAERHQLST